MKPGLYAWSHKLMHHSNIYRHTNNSNDRTEHVTKHRKTQNCHSYCLSSLVFLTFLLFLPSDAFKVTSSLRLASHLFAAIPWGVLSSALLGPVLYCPRSSSLGKWPARHYSFSAILQVSDAFLQSFPLRLPDNFHNRAHLAGKPQTGVYTS